MNHDLFDSQILSIDKAFFNSILKNSHIGSIFILDKNGTILGLSKGVYNSYGYFPEDLKGKHFSVLFIEEDRIKKKPQAELKLSLQTGSASDYNYIVHKDGSHIWTEGESVSVKDSKGEPFIIKIVHNINQQRLLEKFLSASEAKLNLLVDIMDSFLHGIIVVKAARDESGNIKDFIYDLVNKKAAENLGKSTKELIGNSMSSKPPNPGETGNFELHKKVVETGETIRNEFSFEQDGEKVWFKSVYIRFGDGLIISFDNITDQKYAKQELEKMSEELRAANDELEARVEARTKELSTTNDKLIKVNQELDRYAYVISHDLKAPIQAIEGLIPVLKEDYSDKPIDPEGEQVLDMMNDRLASMKLLIDEVLTSAKEKQKTKEPLNLLLLTQQVVENLNPPSHFHIFIQHSLPVVNYHKTSMIQILQNLISNSIKYNDKESPLIKVGSVEFENYYRICVSDNGTGIAEDKLKDIFQSFQVSHSDPKVDSHGLGLSIVRQLVTENGGKVWAESIPGQESHFYFTVPK